jgi:hypothetical protein
MPLMSPSFDNQGEGLVNRSGFTGPKGKSCKRRLGTGLIASVGFLLSLTAAAAGEGSTTIAGAPTIVFGQQEFGTTVGGPHLEKPTGLASFWSLPVIAGDQLTIDWEATLGSSTGIHLYPVGGVNDYTDQEARTVAGQGQSDNGRNQLEYTAPTTGNMILAMVTNHSSGASYNFIADVKHALTLALPRSGRIGHRPTIKVGVHNPEGGVIDNPALHVVLQARVDGRARAIGSSPVRHSVAKIHARLPRLFWGKTAALRAVASGPDYATTRSIVRRVAVR